MKVFAITMALGSALAAPLNIVEDVPEYRNEVWSLEQEQAAGVERSSGEGELNNALEVADMPKDFTWCNKDGVNYCTKSLNQHIPQVMSMRACMCCLHARTHDDAPACRGTACRGTAHEP